MFPILISFKTDVTDAYIDTVAVITKQDARLIVKNIAPSVGISLESAHTILTNQVKLTMFMLNNPPPPNRLTKKQKGYSYENAHLFFTKPKM